MRFLTLIFLLFQGCGWLKPAEPVREELAAPIETQHQAPVADPETTPVSKPAHFPYQQVGLGILGTLLGGTVLIGGPYLAYKWWTQKPVVKTPPPPKTSPEKEIVFDTPEQKEQYEKLNPDWQEFIKVFDSGNDSYSKNSFLEKASTLTPEQLKKSAGLDFSRKQRVLNFSPEKRDLFLSLDEGEMGIYDAINSTQREEYLNLPKEEREKYSKNKNFSEGEKNYIFNLPSNNREAFAKLSKKDRRWLRTQASEIQNEFLRNPSSRQMLKNIGSNALLTIMGDPNLGPFHEQAMQIAQDQKLSPCFKDFLNYQIPFSTANTVDGEFVGLLRMYAASDTNLLLMFQTICANDVNERQEFRKNLWDYSNLFQQIKGTNVFLFMALKQPTFQGMAEFVEAAKTHQLHEKLESEPLSKLDIYAYFFLLRYQPREDFFSFLDRLTRADSKFIEKLTDFTDNSVYRKDHEEALNHITEFQNLLDYLLLGI